MLDTVDFNHVQHISFTQSRLTDAVSVILSELLSYEHPSNGGDFFLQRCRAAARGPIADGARRKARTSVLSEGQNLGGRAALPP